ncbi:hypothetical protein LCGC14_0995350 [marine sediment metagenome]|uniref:Uncharacterized protein n=1 Tax=marine sediment metagenome TaxID=412755 RepID=A0A0F9NR22_9ZZZZ
MGGKLEIYEGRIKFRIINGQLLKLFRRSKEHKFGTRNSSKYRDSDRINSKCTDDKQN